MDEKDVLERLGAKRCTHCREIINELAFDLVCNNCLDKAETLTWSEPEEILERLGAERCDGCHKLKEIVEWVLPHDPKATPETAFDNWKNYCRECLDARL